MSAVSTIQRTCLVSTCGCAVDARRPFCRDHWKMLPGRTRSKLSMTARFRDSAIRREAFERAAMALEQVYE